MGDEHRWIVDRFEGDLAVVEVDDGRFLDMPRWLLPEAAREGDVILVAVRSAEGSDRPEDERASRRVVDLRIDREATTRAREEAERLIDELRRRDPGGDVTL